MLAESALIPTTLSKKNTIKQISRPKKHVYRHSIHAVCSVLLHLRGEMSIERKPLLMKKTFTGYDR